MSTPYDVGLVPGPANYAPMTPLTFLPRAALVCRDKIAVMDGDRRFTYAQLYARCRRFASRRPQAVPNNADFARFVAELRGQGVDVFDPTPATVGPDDPPRFLARDTHWTPEWMRQVAGGPVTVHGGLFERNTASVRQKG